MSEFSRHFLSQILISNSFKAKRLKIMTNQNLKANTFTKGIVNMYVLGNLIDDLLDFL